ncbi:MAG TPA: ABC transporter permease [Vicinamibacteria bacterium]|nr:ABC transporter permease [Vicinamibacteria bacterium]
MLDGLKADVRQACRWLLRSPGFTLAAVASLAIAIGFNSALFSLVDAVLFRPLPVKAPHSLVEVYTSGSDGDAYATSSYPDYLDFKERNTVFTEVVGHSTMFGALSTSERSRLAMGEVVTGNFFPTLGIRAALGRTLLPEDDRPQAERVVVVSHRYWRREMGADPNAVGRTLRLRGQPYTVVGVIQEGYSGLLPMLAAEIWLPTAHVEEVEPAGLQDAVPSPGGTSRLDRRGQRWMFVKGRLKPGVTLEQAQANLDGVMAGLVETYPQTNKDRRVALLASKGVRIHPAADRILVPLAAGLMLLVGLVLLIACANVASMLLARASARRREISIRMAIGARRWHVVRQLLAESVVLGLLGGAAGTTLAFALTRLLTTLDLPLPVPLNFDVRVDARVLAFTALVALVAGVLAGLAPALRVSRQNLVSDLRGEAGGAAVAGRRWSLRDGLVVGQIAVTLALLVVAGLVARSLSAAQHANLGFRTSGLAILSSDLGMARYDEAAARAFWDRALERVRALPEVENAAFADHLPFSLNFGEQQFHIPGQLSPGDRGFTVAVTRVSPEYFQTLGVPILQGRGFLTSDTPESPGVVVVNEAFARRFWPGKSALGQIVHTRGPEGPAFEIVGVSADHRVQSIGEGSVPYVHFSRTQRSDSYQILVARARGDAGRLVAQLRQELLALEPNLVFLDNQTMETQVAATLLPVRAGAWLASVVGVVALALAGIGLYGVVAYSVARRTREIGVRMALGADRLRVLGMVLRQGFSLVAVGLALGAVLAALGLRGLSGVLYGVSLADPLAWGTAALSLALAAAAANAIPAHRATRVNPSVALRAE